MDQLLERRLFEACRDNKIAVIEAEIASGRDLNEADRHGFRLLHYAVLYESLEVVNWLLKQPSIQKDTNCSFHMTALALACAYNKNVECILELIEAGCDLNLRDADDQRSILLIIKSKFMEWEKKRIVIEVLIKNGADLKEPVILEEFIINYNNTNECLQVLHLFIYYNIDVNANGVNLLTFALKHGHLDICDILWDYITDFTLNSNGLLIQALKYGYRFNELIEKGVEINEEMNFFKRADALFALFISRDANAVEILNTLWMRFQSPDEIYTLIENMVFCLRVISNTINKECVTRFLNLLFNFAFESKIDLYYSYKFCDYYDLLEHIALDKDEMIQMFYLFLRCTSRVRYTQLYRLYLQCPKDLFETFLKFTIKIDGICDDLYFEDKFQCILFPDLLPPDMKDEKFPSLVKLSRNAIRKQFQPDRETMRKENLVFFRYYNEVNKLHVPKRIKDILLLNV